MWIFKEVIYANVFWFHWPKFILPFWITCHAPTPNWQDIVYFGHICCTVLFFLAWHNLVGKGLSLCLESKVLGAKKITLYLGNLTSYHCISCEEEQKRPLKPSYKNRTENWLNWRIGSLIHWFNQWFISWIVSLLIN